MSLGYPGNRLPSPCRVLEEWSLKKRFYGKFASCNRSEVETTQRELAELHRKSDALGRLAGSSAQPRRLSAAAQSTLVPSFRQQRRASD